MKCPSCGCQLELVAKTQNATAQKYPELFEQFWKDYPRTPTMSKKDAFSAWRKMDGESRGQAIHTLPAFRQYHKDHPDYPIVHACRYLSQRRFDGFIESVANQKLSESEAKERYQAAKLI